MILTNWSIKLSKLLKELYQHQMAKVGTITQITHWTLFEQKYDKIVDIAQRFYPADVAKATLMT